MRNSSRQQSPHPSDKSPALLYPAGFAAYIDSHENRAEHHIGLHHHGSYAEFLYCIEGERRIRIGTHQHRARAGDLVVFHPAVPHEEWVEPGRFRVICLRFSAEDVASGVPFPGPEELPPVVHLPWKERFRAAFEQIVIENNGVDRWSRTLAGTYLTQFLILLWRALSQYREEMSGAAGDAQARLERIIDIVDNSINTDLSLHDLASEALMSESHLSRVFKDATGLPPKRYLIESRISKAKERLLESRATVVEIASELGYTSSQYFSRTFKKETGLTPLQFRHQSRKVH